MLSARWKRYALALLLVWIGVTLLVISPLRCSGGDESSELQARLTRAATQIAELKRAHTVLLQHIKNAQVDSSVWGGAPLRYEQLRRRLLHNTHDLWNFAHAELASLQRDNPQLTAITHIVDRIAERKRSLVWDSLEMAEADGHAAWRLQEAAATAALVQDRLRALQHPPDCRAARKILCNLNKGCGFGCQVHHIAYCLITAYATERTLIVDSRGWRYNARGWEMVFKPLSENCTSHYNDKPQPWDPNRSNDAQVVSLPFIDSLSHKPRFLPLAIPEDLAPRVMRFNGDPASWWVGQMLRYVLRPQTHLQKTINETIATMPYYNPIVGVHVRRTDKVGTEAAFHHLDEYVSKVHDYYNSLRDQPDHRSVYLATDDPNLLSQAKSRHGDIRWVGDSAIARSAGTQRRYAPASLANLLVDVTLLSRADFLVCTLSSQVCRVAYELMQAGRADAAHSVASLDDIYYFGGQNPHDRIAVIPHVADNPTEISFQVGDLIGVAGNHWNGYGRGTNRRTNQVGQFPWFKTDDVVVTHPFPRYHRPPPSAAPPLPAHHSP